VLDESCLPLAEQDSFLSDSDLFAQPELYSLIATAEGRDTWDTNFLCEQFANYVNIFFLLCFLFCSTSSKITLINGIVLLHYCIIRIVMQSVCKQ